MHACIHKCIYVYIYIYIHIHFVYIGTLALHTRHTARRSVTRHTSCRSVTRHTHTFACAAPVDSYAHWIHLTATFVPAYTHVRDSYPHWIIYRRSHTPATRIHTRDSM
jgi:hypothetical protein